MHSLQNCYSGSHSCQILEKSLLLAPVSLILVGALNYHMLDRGYNFRPYQNKNLLEITGKIMLLCTQPMIPSLGGNVILCRCRGYTYRDGAVVRALASHQCGPGSIPRSGVICGSSLLVLYSAPRGTSVFPSPQKPTFDLICLNC